MTQKQKNSYFHQLLAKTNMRAHKESLLSGYGVASTTELKEAELDALIKRLEDLPTQKTADTTPSVRKLRSKIIMAAELYIGEAIKGGAVWARFNALMMDKRVAGKMLWEMNEDEMHTVHAKLQKMARAVVKQVDMDNFFATNN